MIFVHIGLGKTATTTLQKHVFPELVKYKDGISYNDPELIDLCYKEHKVGLSQDEEARLRIKLAESENIVISWEHFLSWDPHQWERSANKNLKLFGQDAVILVTVRETISYLTSLYQQMIQQGWIISPQEYFVSSDLYRGLDESRMIKNLECIDADSFDLKRLHEIFSSRFPNFLMVELKDIREMSFLKVFSLQQEELEKIRDIFQSAPRENKAYSSFAMKLTFKREAFLIKFGLQSYVARARSWTYYAKQSAKVKYKKSGAMAPVKQNPIKKMISAFLRVINIRCLIQWRCFMQSVVDNLVPYKKYQLPQDIRDSFCDIKHKNDEFLMHLKDDLG